MADEIVSVVESLGLMLGISSGILGVTIIAMSNSLGDWFSSECAELPHDFAKWRVMRWQHGNSPSLLMSLPHTMMCADVAVARNGQGAMSMAACFGAPVLNDLLGFGNHHFPPQWI